MGIDVRWVAYGEPAAAALREAVESAKADDLLAPVTVVVPVQLRRRRQPPRAGATARRGRRGVVPHRLPPRRAARRRDPRRRRSPPRVQPGARRRGARRARSRARACSRRRRAPRHRGGARRGLRRELREVDDAGLDAIAACSARRATSSASIAHARAHLKPQWYDEQDLLAAAAAAAATGSDDAALGTVVVHLPQRLSAARGRTARARSASARLADGDRRHHRRRARRRRRHHVDRTAHARHADAPASVDPHHAPTRRARGSSPPPTPTTRCAAPCGRSSPRSSTAPRSSGSPILHASADPYARLVHEQLAAAGVPSQRRRRACRSRHGRSGERCSPLLALPDHGYRRDDVLGAARRRHVLHEGRWAPAHAWERISRDAGGRRRPRASGTNGSPRIADERERDARRGRRRRGPAVACRAGAAGEAEQTRSLRAFALGLIDQLERAAAAPRGVERARDVGRHRSRERLVGTDARRAEWPEVEREAADKVLRALDGCRRSTTSRTPWRSTCSAARSSSSSSATSAASAASARACSSARSSMGLGLDLDLVDRARPGRGHVPRAVTDDALLPDDERAAAGGDLVLRAPTASSASTASCSPRSPARAASCSACRAATCGAAANASRRAGCSTSRARSPASSCGRTTCSRSTRRGSSTSPSFAAAIGGLALPADEQEHRLRVAHRRDRPRVLATRADGRARRASCAPASSSSAPAAATRFTRFDGNLGVAGLALRSPLDSVVSATRLADLGRVPARLLPPVRPAGRPGRAAPRSR